MKKSYDDLYQDALKEQRSLLIERAPDQSHDQSIESAIRLNKSDDEFSKLIQYVFSHHDISHFQRVLESEVDPLNGDLVSRYFHAQYFDDVRLVQGTDPQNPDVTTRDFVERLMGVKWSGGSNLISFLVGGIGSGKTTFLSNVIYKHYGDFSHAKRIPVKVNIDVENSHEVRPLQETLMVILNTIYNSLQINGILSRNDVERLKRECSVKPIEQVSVIDGALSHLLDLLKERHSLEIILVIDNIDYLYHLGDRGFFADEQHEDQANAYRAIIDLVSYFWRNRGQFRLPNVGISVVFSVRRDTIEFIKSKQNEVPIPGINDNVFSLVDRGKDGALVTIASRFELLKELCGKVQEPRKRAEFIQAAEMLSEAYSKPSKAGARLFDDIWSLCRRGLRDVVDQMADFAWLEFNDERRKQAAMRFSSQYYPSMIAYVTDGHRRYSQFRGNVPNMFLVNAASKNNEFGVPLEFKKNHFFSLWLKFLIASYVHAKRNETVRIDDIVTVFSGRNRRGYPEHLVRYVLGALSEVPAAEIIEVDVSAEGDGGTTGFVRDLNLTKRGRFLLDGFVFSFSYLQLVVDDWRLRLPRSLGEHFEYLEPDYKYLVCEDGEYGGNVRQVIERKGRQAIKFSILLDQTLEAERTIWPRVFERLASAGVSVPERNSISSRVIADVRRAADFTSVDSRVFSSDAEWISSFREGCAAAVTDLVRPCLNLNRLVYGK